MLLTTQGSYQLFEYFLLFLFYAEVEYIEYIETLNTTSVVTIKGPKLINDSVNEQHRGWLA